MDFFTYIGLYKYIYIYIYIYISSCVWVGFHFLFISVFCPFFHLSNLLLFFCFSSRPSLLHSLSLSLSPYIYIYIYISLCKFSSHYCFLYSIIGKNTRKFFIAWRSNAWNWWCRRKYLWYLTFDINRKLFFRRSIAQSSGAVEYTDCFSTDK